MTRHVLNSVINVDLDVKNVVNDFNTRLKQRRKDRLDVEMPKTTSNDVTRPVVKSVVIGQVGVGHVMTVSRRVVNSVIKVKFDFDRSFRRSNDVLTRQ